MPTFSRYSAAILIALTAMTSGACSSQHPTYAPDGRRSYVINCSGFMNSFSSCLVKAGRACGPHGYDTLKNTNDDDRTMFIACKLPEAQAAVTKPQ